jgi:transcriptional regulator with XRE-family HTH domain
METRSCDFQTYLQEELVLRCQRNPAYSLRSFAKALNLSPSFLSKILNGHRKVTQKVFVQISSHLGLKDDRLRSFSLDSENTKVPDMNFNNLQLDYFKVIADWYHYALLELTRVEGFKNSPRWIEQKSGKLVPTNGGNTTLKNDFTDLAFKKMQDDLLKKAITSLWSDELSKRDQTSICMAINPSDIPEVKKRLTKMRRELCKFLERPQPAKPKQVYNLSLSFFALSKESK